MLEQNISPAEFEEKKRTGVLCCPKSHSKEDIDLAIKSNTPMTFGPPVASGSSLEAESSSKYAMLSGPSASAAIAAEAKRLSVPWDQENHHKFFEGKIFLAAVRFISSFSFLFRVSRGKKKLERERENEGLKKETGR